MQRAGDAQRAGSHGRGDRSVPERHRKAAGHGGRLPQAGAVYWRRRPAARGDRDARSQRSRNGVTQSEVRNKLGQYLAKSGQAAARDRAARTRRRRRSGRAGRARQRLSARRPPCRCLARIPPASSTSIQRAGSRTRTSESRSFRRGIFRQLKRSLRKALELEPTLGGAHTALGVVLASTARKADAIDEWKRAIELDGSDLNALFNLTLNLAETGRTQEARSYGERFIAAAPPAMREDVAAVRKAIR